MSASITAAPDAAKASAVARPMPELPPVTSATRPASGVDAGCCMVALPFWSTETEWRGSSDGAAIDRHGDARDQRRRVRAEPDDDRGDLRWRSHTADRLVSREGVVRIVHT